MNTTRREFLKTAAGTSAVISLGATAPQFLLDAAAMGQDRPGETILVVVQLSGGNDGLNTVIPIRDERYREHRPTLAVAESDTLSIGDDLALHPSMRDLADLLEAGKLTIVQGVGYPNPNRSHFESMDIWHSCYRKSQARRDGWLGRYLDAARQADGGDVAAIHLGGEKQPLALAAQHVRVPSIRSLDRFRLLGDDQRMRDEIKALAKAQRATDDELLGFIQSSATSALDASQRVEQATQSYQTDATYPDAPLGEKLRTVAQLIDAGMQTRIYYVEIDGFDTHSQQADAHTSLLRQVSQSIGAFVLDVAAHGHGERVMVMSFSEFGRRVQENASRGTDHGAAAPMILAGGRVRAGVVGAHPSLGDLDDGDLKFHTDFRQVYATLLDQWLGWDSESILGGKFAALPLV